MNDQASLLAVELESYTGLEAAVTFGEPADPTGTGCELVMVWVASAQGRETAPQDCNILSRLTLAYRIYSCYPIQETDLSADQHETAADRLYGYGQQVWCGLVVDKSAGVLMGLACKEVTLGPLVTDPPRGGVASMTGTLVVDYECAVS